MLPLPNTWTSDYILSDMQMYTFSMSVWAELMDIVNHFYVAVNSVILYTEIKKGVFMFKQYVHWCFSLEGTYMCSWYVASLKRIYNFSWKLNFV